MGAPDWFVDVFPIETGDIPASYVIVYQGLGKFYQSHGSDDIAGSEHHL